LVTENHADEPLVRQIVYAFVILRFFDFGKETLPLFPEKEPLPETSTSTVALARIRLQQNVPRKFIAAAPDDVGDGERIRPQPRMRKRSRASNPAMAAAGKPIPPQSIVVPVEVKLAVTATPIVNLPSSSDQTPDGDPPPPMPVVPGEQPETARPAHSMYELAMKRLSEGDRNGAFAACQAACEIDPNQPDYVLLATWIRAVIGGTNLELCVKDLDKLLEDRPDHVPSLFYRGYLRRRTGDESGAMADLQRVLELEPTHQDALRELKRIERHAPAKRPSGMYQT
jgi:hypothetical protein